MNPFDLPGPEFLGFFACLTIAVLVALAWLLLRIETGPPPNERLADPYTIAYLNEGAAGAICTPAVTLLDRGFLVAEGRQLRQSKQNPALVTHPVERRVLLHCNTPRLGWRLTTDPGLRASISASCQPTLQRLDLLPDARRQRMRATLMVASIALLALVALIKIAVALQRGRHNVGYLIMMCLVGSLLCIAILSRRRTSRGDAFLSSLTALFAGLKRRAITLGPGSATPELALLTAVFGLAAVPRSLFRHRQVFERDGLRTGFERSRVERLHSWFKLSRARSRRGAQHTWGDTTIEINASCGSSSASCSAASSSSCGSSCGGGGGGGCGGCGS